MQDAKRRAILFLILALLMASVAGWMFMNEVSQVYATLGDFATVYVARKNISSREPLKPEYFEAREIPVKYLPQSAVTSLEMIEVEGNTYPVDHLTTVVPLKEGDLLTTPLLKVQNRLSSENHRMIVLHRSQQVGFDDIFDVNDVVDIIVTKKGNNQQLETRAFMQKVKVVGVGRDDDGNISSIGLEMTLQEAERFINEQYTAAAIRVLKAPNLNQGRSGQPVPQAVPRNSGESTPPSTGENGAPMHEDIGDEGQ
ncbi:hypothetical protein [Staphylospora marina]|uniref:hypothetical protein n=1 Tax=Staphylospora marina TaxID=2490858 RepID=UPI000F5C1A64|nr:hypothetical protein [Staphylospora marina]